MKVVKDRVTLTKDELSMLIIKNASKVAQDLYDEDFSKFVEYGLVTALATSKLVIEIFGEEND